MKRWYATQLLPIAAELFSKIYQCKQHCSHNHEGHFLKREINDWIPKGITSLIAGTYTPRPIKRYFIDGVSLPQFQRLLVSLAIMVDTFSFFSWSKSELLQQFINSCWDTRIKSIAIDLADIISRPYGHNLCC